MSELIPFSSIPERWDWDYEQERKGTNEPYPYTAEQEEAASFLSKMDWEGGIDGLISYGGYSIFPEELQEIAREYEQLHDELRNAIDDWAAERGVEY